MYQISSVYSPGSNSFLPTPILPVRLPTVFLLLILLHFWGTEVPNCSIQPKGAAPVIAYLEFPGLLKSSGHG